MGIKHYKSDQEDRP